MARQWLQEQGLPFDVILERTPPTYIEVKSTVSRTKQLFQLSVPELRFAEKMGEQYTVYRVYGAGSDDVSLASLRNLAQHLAAQLAQQLLLGRGHQIEVGVAAERRLELHLVLLAPGAARVRRGGGPGG